MPATWSSNIYFDDRGSVQTDPRSSLKSIQVDKKQLFSETEEEKARRQKEEEVAQKAKEVEGRAKELERKKKQ